MKKTTQYYTPISEKRNKILYFIENNPGSHLRIIARKTKNPFTTTRYHLMKLEKENRITGKKEGKYLRFYKK